MRRAKSPAIVNRKYNGLVRMISLGFRCISFLLSLLFPFRNPCTLFYLIELSDLRSYAFSVQTQSLDMTTLDSPDANDILSVEKWLFHYRGKAWNHLETDRVEASS